MAKLACTDKTLEVLEYLKTQDLDANPKTLNDLASELDMAPRSLNGILNAGLQRKGYLTRVPAVIETKDEDGNPVVKNVSFIKLTDEGKAYDHEAAVKADMEAAMEALKAGA